ncbi:MAG: hypothetical protein ABIR70_10610 [Bryobacteraceae bacterium]
MKPMLLIAWSLFALEVLLILWAAAFAAREMGSDAQEKVTTLVFGVIALLVLAAIGATLTYAQRTQSSVATYAGLAAVLLPAMVWVALRGSATFDKFDRAHSKAVGLRFADPDLTAMSAAIDSADAASLRQLLAGKTPDWTARNGVDQTLLGQAIAHVLEDYSGTAGLAAVRILMEAGARPSTGDLGPRRLLMPAIVGGNTPGSDELLDVILEAGGDPNATDEQQEPLIHLLECTLPKLKILVRHKADLHARSHREDRRDWSVLMTAATMRDWDKLDYLLEQGVPPDYKTSSGESVATVLVEVARLERMTAGKLDPRQEAFMTRFPVH